jgi:hypothetical protein
VYSKFRYALVVFLKKVGVNQKLYSRNKEMEINQPKGVKRRMRVRKLKSGINW